MHNLHDVQHRQEPQASAPSSGTLLTAHQVEEMLRVDPSTIYRMAADGRLPAVKVGRQWRFPADGVQALLGGTSTPIGPGGPRLDPMAVQPALDLAASMLGVMLVATDMDGSPISEVANPCPWFAEHADDPGTIAACLVEWKAMADDADLAPHFQTGSLGFQCARVFVRAGSELVGMVLAGGVAPPGSAAEGLYELDEDRRHDVLRTLPKVAAALSTSISRRTPGHRATVDAPTPPTPRRTA